MKNISFSCVFLIICCFGLLSCSDELYNQEFNKITADNQNIENLVSYAKSQYISKKAKSFSNNNEYEPKWDEYEVFKQSEDTLAINIPIGIDEEGKQQFLIANEVDSKKQVYFVSLPVQDYNNLQGNIRRRIILSKDGETYMCRLIADKNGRLQFVRVRDVVTTKSIPHYTLPEIVVYPGGYDYNSDWWWWDYIGGLISFPPPEGYSGYTGYQPAPSQSRPDYYKAENISKDSNVQKAIKTMLQNTKKDVSFDKGRRERGFWVFYDPKTKKYYIGNEKTGDYVKGEGSSSITPGNSSPSDNGSHIPSTATPVTFVHAHTPLTFESYAQREVGFSQSDIDFADALNIEIIVIDYVGTERENGKNYIYGGHDIDDATTEYVYIPNK